MTAVMPEFREECSRLGVPPSVVLEKKLLALQNRGLSGEAFYSVHLGPGAHNDTVLSAFFRTLGKIAPILSNGESQRISANSPGLAPMFALDVSRATLSHVAVEHMCDCVASISRRSAGNGTIALSMDARGLGPRSLNALLGLLRSHRAVHLCGFSPSDGSALGAQVLEISEFNRASVGGRVESGEAVMSRLADVTVCEAISEAPDVPSEEDILASKVASQLKRLCAKVDAIHDDNARTWSMDLEVEHSMLAKQLELESDVFFESLWAARRLECPFTPPVYDPDGPYVSPLRVRDPFIRDAASGRVQGVDELARLKNRLECVMERLRQQCAETRGGEAGGHASSHTVVGSDETLNSIASHYAVAVYQLRELNATWLPQVVACDADSPLPLGSRLLVPTDPELLLRRCLLGERAQAMILAEKVASGASHAAIQVEEAALSKLQERRMALQVYVREVEWLIYCRRRDSRLRVLRYAEQLQRDAAKAFAVVVADHDEWVTELISDAQRERDKIEWERWRREYVPPEELELRQLKAAVEGYCYRCVHRDGETIGL